MPAEDCPKVYLYRRIVQAKLFIDAHFAENINVEDISDESHFSKFHFIRLFKDVYGTTPHQYLKLVRIKEAQELLERDHSVSETCFAVGFNSLSSFSGLFKTITGKSPSAYSRQHKEMAEKIRKTPLAFIPGCYAYQHGWLENSNSEEVREKTSTDI